MSDFWRGVLAGALGATAAIFGFGAAAYAREHPGRFAATPERTQVPPYPEPGLPAPDRWAGKEWERPDYRPRRYPPL